MTTLSMRPAASPARTGVWVAIGAITMSFGAYTSAMVFRQGAATDWRHFQLPALLYLNTLLLLASSATMTFGQRRIRWSWLRTASEGVPELPGPPAGTAWLQVTLALGLLFIAGQVMAWKNLAAQGLFLASNPASSFFYVLTALHAIHLFGGVAGLGLVLYRLRRDQAGATGNALGAVSLYWHFMDVLWIYLFLLLLVWL
jgi:cytochrome c oxidase subunit III